MTSASAHYVSRAGRKRTKYVKILLGVLCAAVIPMSLVIDLGPSHDMKQAWALREKMKATCRPTFLWGDGAFDSEVWRVANGKGWGVPSSTPTTVRRQDGRVGGFSRAAFAELKPKDDGQRWMCERVNSAVKRVSEGTLRSRKENTLFAEAALKIAAYAIEV